MKLIFYLIIIFIIVYPFYFYMKWKTEEQTKKTLEVYLPIKERQLDFVFSRKNRLDEKTIFEDDYIQRDIEN